MPSNIFRAFESKRKQNIVKKKEKSKLKINKNNQKSKGNILNE